MVELDDGRQAVLPQGYVESSTSLGYALTVFRSQGITVDHTFGLGGDSLFQEAGYTQLSRGRLSNNLYVTAPENPRWEVGHHGDGTDRRDALDSLVDALDRSREQTMAVDRLPETTVPAPDDLATTYHEHAALGAWLNDHAPADVTDQLAAALERDQRARATGRDQSGSRPGPGERWLQPSVSATNGSTATRRRSTVGPGWRVSSDGMSTGWAGPPPTRRPGMSPICSVRSPTAWLPPNAGRQPPAPSRPTDPAGMSRIRQRWAPSPPTPSSATIGARPWPLWERQDFSATKDLPGLSRNGGAWRLIGKRCGLLTGHERRIGYGTMVPSSPRRNVTVGGVRTVASIEIAIPDSACEPGHSRRPSNEEIRVHRSGLPRMTPRPRALHRTGHTGRPQPTTRRDLGRRRKSFRLRDAFAGPNDPPATSLLAIVAAPGTALAGWCGKVTKQSVPVSCRMVKW